MEKKKLAKEKGVSIDTIERWIREGGDEAAYKRVRTKPGCARKGKRTVRWMDGFILPGTPRFDDDWSPK